ncbi:putative pectinesterase 29 [Morus notabilis]|uniref:pectinesterase n=1 Tax=Morus notabilis TaxID=981085 RepID=W9R075_9ROSA|nr:probable pectinesterase 29 [Morus notabilis]EXB53020.1 putative pectinesterase 29 [Morus notabilis]
MTWAPAAIIAADKVSFYSCGFLCLQDTLFDARGRHYFRSCYIEGAVDFIWGNGQSFFQACYTKVTASVLGQGGTAYITAQGRESESESTGFVFHSSAIIGTGPAFLGRAYRNHSRVVYYNTHMENIIAPLGWDAWFNVGHEGLLTFAEVKCYGAGANTSARVKWEKQLPIQELRKLIHVNHFLNQDGWIEKQPPS